MQVQKLGHPHVHLTYVWCAVFRDTVMLFQKPRNNEVLYSSPHPHLCPQVHWGRAEWSRAVCGDSDIHRMQWIINEHHLVHTTGEHSSNRLLQDDSLSPSHTLSLTFSPSISPVLSPSLSHFSHTYYHYTATLSFSLIVSPSFFTSLWPVLPHHHSPCSSVASMTG